MTDKNQNKIDKNKMKMIQSQNVINLTQWLKWFIFEPNLQQLQIFYLNDEFAILPTSDDFSEFAILLVSWVFAKKIIINFFQFSIFKACLNFHFSKQFSGIVRAGF